MTSASVHFHPAKYITSRSSLPSNSHTMDRHSHTMDRPTCPCHCPLPCQKTQGCIIGISWPEGLATGLPTLSRTARPSCFAASDEPRQNAFRIAPRECPRPIKEPPQTGTHALQNPLSTSAQMACPPQQRKGATRAGGSVYAIPRACTTPDAKSSKHMERRRERAERGPFTSYPGRTESDGP